MTLFNLTTRNIRKNLQNYSLYFVSMVFSIMVFYIFVSIQYNEQVAQTVGETTKTMLKLGAICAAVFSAIFIGYSNSFFTRKRKKEIGLYSLLGLQKKQIARMLFYENLVMGVTALGVGMIVGSMFSKLFVMLFFRLMGHFVQVYFAISPQAILTSAAVFSLIFTVISLYAYSLIYRFKLVDLFYAEQSGETEPNASLPLALVSIAAIVAGYFLAFHLFNNFNLYAPMVLILVIAGSYGLFHSFIVFVIRRSRKNLNRYYQGLNLISISNLLYRIKSNATLLATIAVLSATTLTAMGMSYGVYSDINKAVDHHNPFSYVYWNDDSRDREVERVLAKYPQNPLLHSGEISFISALGIIHDDRIHFSVVPESDYNELARIKGWEKVDITRQQEAVIVHSDYDTREDYLYKEVSLALDEENRQEFYITDRRSYKLTNNSNTWTSLVLNDAAYEQLTKAQEPGSLRVLMVDDHKNSQALTAELQSTLPAYSWNSYYSEYMRNMEQRGMLMFIGGFLGLVFLLATGSIIYFRQLNEAQKEKINYQILRNIGLSRGEIHSAIRKQLLYVFLFPLLVGIAHSWAALMALADLLVTNLVVSTIVTIVVFTVIYFIYYLMTVKAYNRIVNSEK
ncbi:MAG: ABC transporter permease [Syntrophomonadaceae bacterium]|nr:ABC transporter permease [Syntrophomonadaceae bacterium]